MSYQEELAAIYDAQAKKIKELYDRHKGSYIPGQLDGEPWADEESALKKAMLEKIEKLNRKYNKE